MPAISCILQRRFSAGDPRFLGTRIPHSLKLWVWVLAWLLCHSLSHNSDFLLAAHILAFCIHLIEQNCASWKELLYQLTAQHWKNPVFESYQLMIIIFQTVLKKKVAFFQFFLYIYVHTHTYIYAYILKHEEIMSRLVPVETSSWIEQIMYHFSQVISLLNNEMLLKYFSIYTSL